MRCAAYIYEQGYCRRELHHAYHNTLIININRECDRENICSDNHNTEQWILVRWIGGFDVRAGAEKMLDISK